MQQRRCDRLADHTERQGNETSRFLRRHSRRDDFVETFPDNGDIDMIKAGIVYNEVGYPYMLTPDYVPAHPDDPGRLQALAFAYGYIRAVMQALEHMG